MLLFDLAQAAGISFCVERSARVGHMPSVADGMFFRTSTQSSASLPALVSLGFLSFQPFPSAALLQG